ncbi:endonuclease NucS domain-containing protein [Luteimonas sp. 3794]|uniref:endonuclease NucS domain-containing protein n=1 Tax=Luteimonas sp. 3794 TaxID=2817730 RepID=UPI002862C90E|nr:endonuclease NucS domain-containing protein [Luteimonas sp. 3794]MDR6990456.1 hypothetical protein [Luteimonas sp. 3794]
MARTIYDKPTRALLKDMLIDLGLMPGQVLTTSRALDWFGQRYPRLQPNSIRAHLVQAATNDPSRLHHASTKASDDLLFKVAPGQFRLYEPGKDPAPIHELVDGDVAIESALHSESDAPVVEASAGSTEFLLERDLQLYLARHLECIEPGLRLYDQDDVSPLEFDAGGRRIDILATDRDGGLVAIELKVSRGYDRVIGQLLRYVNWVRHHLAAPGQNVRGIIVCRTITEDLRLACASLREIELFEYQLSVQVARVPALMLRNGTEI